MSYQMLTKPYDHQQRVFDASKDRKEFAIFWEMGVGKSKITLDTIGHLYTEGRITGALIVAPKGVYQNWYYDEIEKHLGLEDYYYGLYSSSPKKWQKEEMELMLQRRNILTICCMNIEAFSHKSGFEYALKFLRTHKTIMVIDESTAIKTPKATRTKSIIKLGQLAEYKRILSGTPITQSPLDLFGQSEFLKKGMLGFTSWTAFKSYYSVIQQMRMGTRSFGKIVGFRNLEELEESMKKFSSRIKKEDCLDLPEKVYETRYVELSTEQEHLYNQMKDEALIELNKGMVTSTSALTTVVKLHQILCGHCKSDNGEVNDIPNNRIATMLSIIEDIPGKIIIWGNYQRDIELIVDTLLCEYGQHAAVSYYGPTSAEDRQENITKFRTDDRCRFFVASSAGSKGITLVEATTVIYYSNGYNLETRLQSEDRCHRIGQKNTVTYIDLVVPKTIDSKIITALKKKQNLADSVMDALRDELTGK